MRSAVGDAKVTVVEEPCEDAFGASVGALCWLRHERADARHRVSDAWMDLSDVDERSFERAGFRTHRFEPGRP